MTVPSYRYSCGTALPWTVAKIAAAKEHAAEIEGFDELRERSFRKLSVTWPPAVHEPI